MQLDLTRLGRHGDEHIDRTFEPSAFGTSEDAEYRVVAPAHLVIDVRRLQRNSDVYLVTGSLETRLELACGRCLEPFQIPVHSTFELRYVPQQQNEGEDEREIGEDDLTVAYYADHTIDLGGLMAEQFELALPMKPLCTDDCKGLCPECGSNLNTTSCDCSPAWQDPRLVVLKGFLDTSKEKP